MLKLEQHRAAELSVISKNFKYILLIFCFLCFSLNCFAGNILQQQDEIDFLQKTNVQHKPNYNPIWLIMEDYSGYVQGKNAFYGYIDNGLKDIDKFPNKEINQKYLKLIKNKLDIIINSSSNTKSNYFVLSKIVVDDADYQQLSENTKMIVQMYNYIVSNNQP